MDEYVTEIVVVLDKRYEDKMKEAADTLKAQGVDVTNTDNDNNVIEGTIEASKVDELEKLDCVDYVRKVFCYAANYPPGDPRDRDGE